MPGSPQDAPLFELKLEIEGLLAKLRHAVLVENGVEILDLTAAQWRLSVQFGKLIFSAWNSAKSFSRRVEQTAYRDGSRFGLFVRKPAARGTTTLEFRELSAPASLSRAGTRSAFRQQLLAMLEREYRGWKFARVSNRSDREYSFSAWYTRGLATQGRSGWAFLGLSEDEGDAAADQALAFGLIWLDWLRRKSEGIAITGLKFFLPSAAVPVNAHRAAYLNAHVANVEIYDWRPGAAPAMPVDVRDYGNVGTRLTARRQAELLQETHTKFLRELLGDCAGLEIMPDSAGVFSSVRFAGLEVARVEGQLAPRAYFGLEGSVRRLDESCPLDFKAFLAEVRRIRRADSPEPAHDFYKLQSERWLESLLYGDITRVDATLSPTHVYPQVPAFSGTDRGVIDLLTATRHGRLAVVELKVQEEINLPLQGLDYWLRVNWLQVRKQFQEFGYFSGCELSPEPPLLYLVSPAFRFHSTTQKLLRYFDQRAQVILVGINDTWRKGVKILFRRAF